MSLIKNIGTQVFLLNLSLWKIDSFYIILYYIVFVFNFFISIYIKNYIIQMFIKKIPILKYA